MRTDTSAARREGERQRHGAPGPETLTMRAQRRAPYWPAGMSAAAWALKRMASDAQALRAVSPLIAASAHDCARWMAGEIIAGVR
jgi:hypothetical protein